MSANASDALSYALTWEYTSDQFGYVHYSFGPFDVHVHPHKFTGDASYDFTNHMANGGLIHAIDVTIWINDTIIHTWIERVACDRDEWFANRRPSVERVATGLENAGYTVRGA